MSRHIDYDAIDYRNDRLHDKSEEFLNGVIYMAQRIEEAPSIDIVICKECKHWCKGDDVYGICYRCPNIRQMRHDDFCSRGKRKESE